MVCKVWKRKDSETFTRDPFELEPNVTALALASSDLNDLLFLWFAAALERAVVGHKPHEWPHRDEWGALRRWGAIKTA